MQMKKARVVWEKSVEIYVYVPSDMSDADIEQVAYATAERIDRDGWAVDMWTTRVESIKETAVPDEELRLTERVSAGGHRYVDVVQGSRLDQMDAMVVDDDRTEIVNPTDATWWLAKDVTP